MPPTSAITWSAASSHSTASGSVSATRIAAAAIAGALLRPTGSSRMRGPGDAGGAELLGDQEAVLLVADDDRRGEALAAGAQRGFL